MSELYIYYRFYHSIYYHNYYVIETCTYPHAVMPYMILGNPTCTRASRIQIIYIKCIRITFSK